MFGLHAPTHRTLLAALVGLLLATAGVLAPASGASAGAVTGNQASGRAPTEPTGTPPAPGRHGSSSTPSTVGAVGAPLGASVTVPQTPVGLSLEYPLMEQYLGSGACPPPSLDTELQQLGSPPISLAGNSQDLTAPAGALTTPFPSWDAATLYNLPTDFWTQLHCLLETAKDPLTVGINAKIGQLAWAQAIVAGAQSAATNGLNFSLGNEPDLYFLPDYSSLGKNPPNEEKSANLYLQVAAYLAPAVGTLPLIGPELANPDHWQHQFPRVVSALKVSTVGVHLYPLSACGNSTGVTVARLLSAAVGDAPASLAWVVRDARAAGLPPILSEVNSAACGGEAGVSNSPASAVWAVRFVLSALKTGFQQVRFHASGGPYDPFVFNGAEIEQRPLAIAMAALNRWLPVGSTLQTLHTPAGIIATAVSGTPGGATLICDNETARRGVLKIAVSGPSAHVQLIGPETAALRTFTLTATHGQAELVLKPNSVAAVLAAG
jgi:hypothetical protein